MSILGDVWDGARLRGFVPDLSEDQEILLAVARGPNLEAPPPAGEPTPMPAFNAYVRSAPAPLSTPVDKGTYKPPDWMYGGSSPLQPPVAEKPPITMPEITIPVNTRSQPQYAPASTQFQQAGMQYRQTAEQNALIQQALGANTERAQLAAEYGPDAVARQQRIASAMDVEAVKARKANEQQALLEQGQQADREEGMERVRQTIDEHAKLAAPDPAQYWKGLGFAGSVGMILADALNTAGAGIRGQQASSIIDKEIERSLRIQQGQIDKSKQNIQEAQGLYGQLRQGGLDQNQAFMAAKSRRLEDAAALVDSYSRQAKTAETQYNLEQQAVDLREKSAQAQLALYESVTGQGKGKMVTTGGGPSVADQLKQAMAIEAYKRAQLENKGLEQKLANGPETDKSLAKAMGDEVSIRAAIDKYNRDGGANSALTHFGLQVPIISNAVRWWDPKATTREGNVQSMINQEMKQEGAKPSGQNAEHYGHEFMPSGVYDPSTINDRALHIQRTAEAKSAALLAAASRSETTRLRNRTAEETRTEKASSSLRGK